MGQALYRKYRSKSLQEVVGQEHITTALSHALNSGSFSHAYLFTGPRGVGKTSIARILAHEFNKLPYDETATHLDIIEIDAASNRRIDEIRDLRDKVHIAPSSAQYKVYIIDEVHMLTKEAFNALLKTLEEPPAHVIFILATTEVHKLPETIISRTQRFHFKPVSRDKVVKHLRYIAEQEGINITDSALKLIADHGEGSFRDSISMLDQARNIGEKIDASDVESILGIAPDSLVDAVLAGAFAGDTAKICQELQAIVDAGYTPSTISKKLSSRLRTQLVDQTSPNPSVSLRLLNTLLTTPATTDPLAALEVALLDAALQIQPQAATTVSQPVVKPAVQEKSAPKPQVAEAAVETEIPMQEIDAEAQLPEVTETSTQAEEITLEPSTPRPAQPFDVHIWHQTLGRIKKTHNTLYGVLRMATPELEDDTLHLYFYFGFHQKRINETRNRAMVADTLAEVCGTHYSVECHVDQTKADKQPMNEVVVNTATPTEPEPTPAPAQPEPTPPAPEVSSILNVFGGGEILPAGN